MTIASEICVALAEERFKHTLTVDGKPQEVEFIVEPPNVGTRRAYTAYLENLAIQSVINHRSSYGKEYKEVRADLATSAAAGKFKWGGEVWGTSLADDENATELCYMVLKQRHPELSRLDFKTLFEAEDTMIDDDDNEVKCWKGRKIFNAIVEFIKRPN